MLLVQPNIDAYKEKWTTPESEQVGKVARLLSESGRLNRFNCVA